MLKPTIAVKIAGGVIAAIAVTGGGVAIATASSPFHVNTAGQHQQPGAPGQANQDGRQDQRCGPAGASPSGTPHPSASSHLAGKGNTQESQRATASPRPSGDPNCTDGKNPCLPAITPSPQSGSQRDGQRGNDENCQHGKQREPGKRGEPNQPGNGPGNPTTR